MSLILPKPKKLWAALFNGLGMFELYVFSNRCDKLTDKKFFLMVSVVWELTILEVGKTYSVFGV
jgi:hypothetical protein